MPSAQNYSINPPSVWVPALFAAWNAAGIRFAVLRNYEQLPDHPGNDIDVLVEKGKRDDALMVLRSGLGNLNMVQHHLTERGCHSVRFYEKGSLHQYHIDLFDELLWRFFPLLDTAEVIGRSRRYKGFRIPCATDEAVVNLLTRLLYGGEIREKYRDQISSCVSVPGFTATLDRCLGSRSRVNICKCIVSGDWTRIETNRRRYRINLALRTLFLQPVRVARIVKRDVFRIVHRLFRLPGLFVALVGPDGCGKTSVGIQLRKDISGTFYHELGRHLHWKARLVKKESSPTGTPCIDPHALPVRNRAVSVCYFLAHSLELILAHWVKVRPLLFINGCVVVDRYYYDFFVDPRRYRLQIPLWLVRTVYFFIPKPDLILEFDAPTPVLQSRKQEVSPEETERQRQAYASLVSGFPQGRIINAAQPLADVVNEALQVSLDYIASRFVRRYGRRFHLESHGSETL